jgi:hypothetical protein
VAALVPEMFCNFYLVKKHNFANDPTAAVAREKIIANLESLEFYNYFDAGLTKLKNNQTLLIINLATDF